MQLDGNFWSLFAIGFGLFMLVFLGVREFWCWYFKVNQIRDLLERIEENTRGSRPRGAENVVPKSSVADTPRRTAEDYLEGKEWILIVIAGLIVAGLIFFSK